MQDSILTTLVLPIALAIIMLGLGLSLKSDDFLRIFKYPKAVTIGLIGQLVILPIIALAIVKIIPMPPAIAVGLIVLALCPCGPSSNMITYLAGGDVALAVTLTVFSSIITIFTIPLFASLAVNSFLGTNAIVSLPIVATMGQIFLITVIPIALGMLIQNRLPELARRLEKATNKLAVGFLVLIIILLVAKEWSKLPGFIVQAGMGVMLLNILGMAAGYAISKLLNLNIAQQICIAIEVGIQNGTLAIAITAGILKDAEMAIPAAIYSLFMYLTGFAVIFYSKNLTSNASEIPSSDLS
ncbi:bile acid:sodium symporter family protein [Chamaesiphon polymorphus]|uniref:Bile acid:sodium symporter n=1 Tax=Chamaesiphon polymorphus CCALA 037 TaxID=2107692 RepID=A0A2T1GIE6_9CYAN|nr:bile acid:sodium symporter family protein [Chamaesiphon polymorphus]PSB57503.1 bile acid:sodium symporter [Chamaesiphon polymorphus CCALA 037]